MNTITLDRVGKRYAKDRLALDGVSLVLDPGVTVLRGRNGSGKSTLLRILATLVRPTSGMASWNGADLSRSTREYRRSLGYLPQSSGVYPLLTAVEFLQYVSALKGIGARAARAEIDALLEQLGLSDARDRPLAAFSGGMRQRVGIAQALLGAPSVVVLDEPTAGLDPEQRENALQVVRAGVPERIVVFTTHIADDVTAIADRVVVLDGGRLIEDRPARSPAAAVPLQT
jgi:ABC-2 type transport system ATP-binding protein